jgi:hypothetical protein
MHLYCLSRTCLLDIQTVSIEIVGEFIIFKTIYTAVGDFNGRPVCLLLSAQSIFGASGSAKAEPSDGACHLLLLVFSSWCHSLQDL